MDIINLKTRKAVENFLKKLHALPAVDPKPVIGGSIESEAQTHGMSHIGNGLATKGRQSMPGQAHALTLWAM